MDKEKKLKKKLFIGGAYLVVALLLLIYVSYSAYRIKIAARVQMPEALEQKASLDLEYSQRAEQALDPSARSIVLNNLMPNESAQAYKNAAPGEAELAGRVAEFKVSNASLIDANSHLASSEYSKLRTKYKIMLEETGVVPLEAILVDSDGNTYTAKTWDVYEKRNITFQTPDGKDAVFTLRNDQVETDAYKIYFGWNNDKGVYDGSERKEIASVELQAQIVEDIPWMATGSSIPAPTVDWYYSKSTPSNATISNATPANATLGQLQ